MTTFPPIINAFSTRPNVQQDSGDEYISDPRSERTMFLPSGPSSYTQQPVPEVFVSQGGHDGLSNVAVVDQMYNAFAPSAADTGRFPDQHEIQYEPGALPVPNPFFAQAQSPQYEYHPWPMHYHTINPMSGDSHTMQEPPAYAQQPQGYTLSSDSVVPDVLPAQEGLASSLGRKRSRRKERITCPFDGCGREMSRDSLGRHMKEIHRGQKRKKPRRDEQDS